MATTLWQIIVRGRRAVGVALALAALLALAGCAGGNASSGEAAVIDVTVDKTDDTAEVTIEDGRALIDVTSASGIGGLTAILSEGDWPEEIVVRLHTRGLERLEIGYANYLIETGVASSDGVNPALMLTVIDEEGNAERASPSAIIYYPTIRVIDDAGQAQATPTIPLPEGSVFEITLPAHFHQETYDSFWLQWIDFYR
jgi:hypothetical protein